jgi:hypothetical protein
MPETTLTVVLGGDIPLDQFVDGMQRFRRLIDELTLEISGDVEIAWVIDELAGGSAIATIRGESDQAEGVERVVKAYASVGKALEQHEVIPYSPRVVSAARSLTAILNGKITSIRFETETDSSTVTTGEADQSRSYLAAFGAVEGRIETLRSRRRLGFTLYDSLNDQAVNCLLRSDQVELVRNAWGKRVIVQGWVKRESTTGRPFEIAPVENIDILGELNAGSYRRARGIAPAPANAPSIEAVIRQLRDA